jgi:hypothetical protein
MEGVLAAGRVDAQPYNWPHDAPMDSKTTALVIIDMQNDCKYTNFNALLASSRWSIERFSVNASAIFGKCLSRQKTSAWRCSAKELC